MTDFTDPSTFARFNRTTDLETQDRTAHFLERAKQAPTEAKARYWAERARQLIERLKRTEARR